METFAYDMTITVRTEALYSFGQVHAYECRVLFCGVEVWRGMSYIKEAENAAQDALMQCFGNLQRSMVATKNSRMG